MWALIDGACEVLWGMEAWLGTSMRAGVARNCWFWLHGRESWEAGSLLSGLTSGVLVVWPCAASCGVCGALLAVHLLMTDPCPSLVLRFPPRRRSCRSAAEGLRARRVNRRGAAAPERA